MTPQRRPEPRAPTSVARIVPRWTGWPLKRPTATARLSDRPQPSSCRNNLKARYRRRLPIDLYESRGLTSYHLKSITHRRVSEGGSPDDTAAYSSWCRPTDKIGRAHV